MSSATALALALALALVTTQMRVCCCGGVSPRPSGDQEATTGQRRPMRIGDDSIAQLLRGIFSEDTVITAHPADDEHQEREEQEEEGRVTTAIPHEQVQARLYRSQNRRRQPVEAGAIEERQQQQQQQQVGQSDREEGDEQQPGRQRASSEEEASGGTPHPPHPLFDASNVQRIVSKMFGGRNVQMGHMKMVQVPSD